ncbi:F-box domain-containing protein [Mycena venus]|uniref:F-box domain-containing protein n=1 Tax=Mycena venus TaxID=2733690 RepID=A0A8H7CXN8_9AGAR|nr:F-box domain-containing protein [Mycena venus]
MTLDTHRIPALELPYELISHIFIYCLPLRRRVRPHWNRAPLNLASICSQWRAVAIATPELWTSIYLVFDGRDAYDGIPLLFSLPDAEPLDDHTAALMDLWFSRTAGHPLSISLICSPHHSLPVDVVATIAGRYTQWGRVELAMPMADFLVFNEVAGPFPCLTSLSLQITDRFRPFSDIHINAVHHSPHLNALQLMDPQWAPTWLDDSAAIPRTLTVLSLVSSVPSVAYFSSVLDQNPHLLHLSIECLGPVPVFDGPRLTAPTKSLMVSDVHLLHFFTMPDLQYLHVSPLDAGLLVDFLSHSQCQLTTLSLHVWKYQSIETFTHCLSALPTLNTLVLVFPDPGCSSTARYQALQRSELVPGLRVLIVTDMAQTPVYEPVVALLQVRPTLVHFELHMWPWNPFMRRSVPSPSPHIEAQLAALAHGGMIIRVMTQTYALPWNAKDEDPVGDLGKTSLHLLNSILSSLCLSDCDVFTSHLIQPYSFSPF